MERERSERHGSGPVWRTAWTRIGRIGRRRSTILPPSVETSAGIQRSRGPAVAVDRMRLSRGTSVAVRESWRVLWTSRLVVWAAGILGVIWFGRVPGTEGLDYGGLSSSFSPFGNLLVAPAARWDSAWYLLLARDGYAHSADHVKAAFYPLYPLLMHAGGWIVGSQLVAGILISVACFFAALVLLYRLTEIELGAADARGTLLLMAFAPAAFFFSAVYTESLFLMLSVGAILAARQGRWAWAGIAGGLAALTRNSGIVVLVPLLVLYLYGPRADADRPAAAAGSWWRPRHPLTRQVLWLALVPAGLALFLVYCAFALGDALAPFHVQHFWYRHTELLGGVTGGASAAWHELRELVTAKGPLSFTRGGTGPFYIAGQSLMLFGFLVFALVALVGVLRRLPLAYGAYVASALVLTLSSPVAPQPLASFPRYVAVLFPLQMWLARWCNERGRLERTVGISAVLLGIMTAQFARWGFVA
jgi:hypothetical protein